MESGVVWAGAGLDDAQPASGLGGARERELAGSTAREHPGRLKLFETLASAMWLDGTKRKSAPLVLVGMQIIIAVVLNSLMRARLRNGWASRGDTGAANTGLSSHQHPLGFVNQRESCG